MTKTVDKPRALQHKGNLEKRSIIMVSKRKESRDDTDNNKNTSGVTQEVKGAGKEERLNSQCLDYAGAVEIIGGYTMTLKFKKHSNGWSIKRKKRGHADYQPFIRWYKNERALRIWYHTFYTRDFQF